VVYIDAVHMSDGTSHEHIASVRWKDPGNGESGESSRSRMVTWIRAENGQAYVGGNDNLLALPRY
jgi:hypothetical protein